MNLFQKIKPIVESIIVGVLTFLQYLRYATFRRLGLFGYLGQAIFVAIGSIYATGIPIYCKIFKRDEADCMTLTTLTISIVIGIIYFLVDGIFFKGFLRTSVTITGRAFDSTEIKIKFGNIFYQDGWIVVSVNEFFDNILGAGAGCGREAINHRGRFPEVRWRGLLLARYPHERPRYTQCHCSFSRAFSFD